MEQFRAFLKKCKEDVMASDAPVRIVLGNTSGDMDSIVGALGLAWFYTLRSGQQWIPVISCDRQDFKLRCEIFTHVCEDCKIPFEDLIFWDEFISQKSPIEEIGLIDHNLIDPIQMEQLGDAVAQKVTHIIDHHVDLKAYPAEQLKESVIMFVGSACSVALNQMAKNLQVFPEGTWEPTDVATNSFAYFYAAAVSLDTFNFSEELRNKKWQADDETAWNFVKQYYPFTDEYFKRLSDCKFDMELAMSHGYRGAMTRDYKNYDLKGEVNGEPFEGRIGISVSVNPIKKVFDTFGAEECFSHIDYYMDEKKLSMYGVSCTVHGADHKVSRHIMLYSKEQDSLGKTYNFLLEKIDEDDVLKACNKITCEREGGKGRYAFWDLQESSVSRKKFEAFLRRVLKC